MKITIILIIAMCFLLSGCITPTRDGYSKPTVMTNPLSYLDKFPLEKVTKESLINNLGIPDKTRNFEKKTYYSYELGYGYGKRQYVYELTNNTVTNVSYHDQGPYSGVNAKQRQQSNKE